MSHISSTGSGGGITPGVLLLNYTEVTSGMSPYTVLPTDAFLGVDSLGGPITILLPNAPAVGTTFVVKDIGNDASVDNITVTTVGGTDIIDIATTFVMNTDLQSAQFLYAGSSTYYIY